MTVFKKPKAKPKGEGPKKAKPASKPGTKRKRAVIADETKRHVERDGLAGVDDVGDELAATKAAFSRLDVLAAGFIASATVLAPQVETAAEALSNARQCLSLLQQYREIVEAAASCVAGASIKIEFIQMKAYEEEPC